MNIIPPARAVIVAVSMSAAISSCGSVGKDSNSIVEPAFRVSAEVTSSTQIASGLPLASYLLSEADEAAYFQAVGLEKKACAAEYGVISTEPDAVNQASTLVSLSMRRYGVVNRDEVERYGYHLPSDPVSDGGTNSDGRSSWNPSAREVLILSATDEQGKPIERDPVTGKKLPKLGCGAEAYRRMRGGADPIINTTVTRLFDQSWDYLLADSRFHAAEEKWAACMTEAGYPGLKHRWEAAEMTSGSDEVTTAIQDLDCAQSTGYLDTAFALDSAYQELLIDRNESELRGVQEGHRQVMDRVHRALKTSS